MDTSLGRRILAPRSIISRLHDLPLRVSFSRWMMVLVGVTLAGYVAFAGEYYLIDRAHRDLLKANSTYIELEESISAASVSHRLAVFAATHSEAMPSEAIRSTALEFAQAAIAASAANKVPALEGYFEPVLSGAASVKLALAGPATDLVKLRDGLDAAALNIGLLHGIAYEGRKAEWENLLAGSKSNFAYLIALVCIGAVLVGTIGYLISAFLKRTIANVISINSAIAAGKLDVDIPKLGGGTEVAQLYAALNIFHRNTVEKARLEADAKIEGDVRQQRQQRVEEKIVEFRKLIQGVLAAVGDDVERMKTTAKAMSDAARETSEQAGSATEASAEASLKVQAVAASATELAASIDEISRQVDDAKNIIRVATDGARMTNNSVASLSDSAKKIGEVVTLIRDVADRTNLLALNATIEAARAGEMGRGFAVVAAEVKSLAFQTSKSTEEIAAQIGEIQKSTKISADSIHALALKMEEVNSFATAIAHAVLGQGNATAEISENIQRAAVETHKAARNMTSVTSAVDTTLQSAATVEKTSSSVVVQMDAMRSAIGAFLKDVAAV